MMSDDVQDTPFREEIRLSDADRDLIQAYRTVRRTIDELPYTDDFEELYKLYTDAGHRESKNHVFRRLLNLRKAALLPRLYVH